MADLFRLGVSLFLVDRISSDLRRVGYSSRSTARDVEILDTKVLALNRAMASQSGAERATMALRSFNRENNMTIAGLNMNIKALDQYRIKLAAIESKTGGIRGMAAGLGVAAAYTGRDELEDQKSLLLTQKDKLVTATKQGDIDLEHYNTLKKSLGAEEERNGLMRQRTSIIQQQTSSASEFTALTGFGALMAGTTGAAMIEGTMRAAAPIEQQMSMLQAIAHMPKGDLENLFRLSQQIAGQTGMYSGGDVFGIATSMILSGTNPKDITTLLPSSTLAAEALQKAGRGDANEIAGTLVKLGTAYGITSDTGMHKLAEQVFSLLSVAPYGVSTSEFATRALTIKPSMMAMGGSYEDALKFAAFSEFAGGRGGLTSNLLFTFLSHIASPGVGAAGAKARVGMAHLGIRPGEGIEQVTKQLVTDFTKMKPQEFAAWAMLAFGGIRGSKTAEALATMGPAMAEIWTKVNAMMANAAFEPIEKFQAQAMDNLQAQMTNLTTNLQSIQQTIGHDVNPTLVDMAKKLNLDVLAMNDWLTKHPNAAVSGTLLFGGTSLAVQVAGYGLLGAALSNLAPGFEALTPIFAGLATYAAPLIAAGALASAVMTTTAAHPEAGNWFLQKYANFEDWLAAPSRTLPPAVGPVPGAAHSGLVAPPMAMHGDIHVHIGSDRAKDAESIKRAVAEGIHKSIYNLGSPAEGVDHEWPFTSPDLIST